MRLVFIGLSLSSSWGNGHATTYRALLRALADRGHDILFLERDQPWYAAHRDLPAPDYCQLRLYGSLDELRSHAGALQRADAVVVGSYVAEGIDVGRWAIDTASGPVAFYDIDTPVTLAAIARGDCAYLSADLIAEYDLYLSFTGGPTLTRLMEEFKSPDAAALYCSVDETSYRPIQDLRPRFHLGYLGTYSPDRQPTLERLLLEPARQAQELRFVVAGPQYPSGIDWPDNVLRIEHVAPKDHPAFYAACRWTLNVTRADMIEAGYSPSVRLFEAAACGTPIISDWWDGLDSLLEPEREILIPGDAQQVLAILRERTESERISIASAARARVIGEHTAGYRARQFEDRIERVLRSRERGGPCLAALAAG